MNWFRRNWLYLLAFTLPFERIPSYDLILGGHSLTIRASFILALIVVAAGLWDVVRRRRFLLGWPDKWLVAYSLVMVASAGIAMSRSRSLQVIFATVLLFGVVFVIERTLQRFELDRLYRYLIAATVVVCVLGLLQFIGDSFGLPTSITGLKAIYTREVFGFPRIQSVALEPLFFASFLLLPITMLVARLYTRGLNWRFYGLLWFVVMIFALTLSRGGIYGGLVSLVAVAVLLWRRGSVKHLAAIAATVTVAGVSALGLIAVTTKVTHTAPAAVHNYVAQSTHLTSNVGSADSDRSENRKLALRAFKAHPLLGVGIGNFGYYAQQNDPRYAKTSTTVVNDEYLEILAETGVVGFVTLLGFVLALIWQVYRSWSRLTGEARVWVAGLLAALIGSAIQFYAFSTLYIIHIWFAIGLLLALTGKAATRDAAKAKKV